MSRLTARDRLHQKYCPAGADCVSTGGPGSEACDRLSGMIADVVGLELHNAAERLRNKARRIETSVEDKHDEVSATVRHGARRLREGAEDVDPFDVIAGTDIHVWKSDGRPVRP